MPQETSQRLLDETGWKILDILQEQARLSFSELGKRVGLTAQGVADRVRRMEEAGIIRGYRALIDLQAIGLSITAYMQISAPFEQEERFATLARATPEVLECHFITGHDTYIIKVAVRSVAHLEALIKRLQAASDVTTSIVLSSPVLERPITRSVVDGTLQPLVRAPE